LPGKRGWSLRGGPWSSLAAADALLERSATKLKMGSGAEERTWSGSGRMRRGKNGWIGMRRERLGRDFCARGVVGGKRIPRLFDGAFVGSY
jgi:hypothetical protein